MRAAPLVLSLLLGCAKPSAPVPPATPPPAPSSTLVVPIERGNTGFEPGDEIVVTRVVGDRADIAVGGSYVVEGKWKLRSHSSARLALWSTNGETTGKTPRMVDVNAGEGDFAFDVVVLAPGFLHVSYYDSAHGNSFGGTYFGTGDNVYRGGYVPGR